MTPLLLTRIYSRADITSQLRHITQQEGRNAETTARCTAGASNAKGKLAGTVRVAWYTQVDRATEVNTKLKAVVSLQLRQVCHHLILALVLIQRAVAAIDSE